MTPLLQWYFGVFCVWRFRLWKSLPLRLRTGLHPWGSGRSRRARAVRWLCWLLADVLVLLRDVGPWPARGRSIYLAALRQVHSGASL
ncbi:MAG: hypothetical protein H7099_11665 [Gemmatimonadaceae bacterium]|nr:hypothetical protein [Gemmatimonadaceae bacterium]